jgi:hypothetical protein
MNETYSLALLQQSPEEGKRCVAQVLQRLNSYKRYYLRAIETEMDKPALPGSEEQYDTGWLGGFFVRLMEPAAEGKIGTKLKSPKDHQPASLPDPEDEIRELISGEE